MAAVFGERRCIFDLCNAGGSVTIPPPLREFVADCAAFAPGTFNLGNNIVALLRPDPKLRNENLLRLCSKHFIHAQTFSQIFPRGNSSGNPLFSIDDAVADPDGFLQPLNRNHHDAIVIADEPVSRIHHDSAALNGDFQFASVFCPAGIRDNRTRENRETAAAYLGTVSDSTIHNDAGKSLAIRRGGGQSTPQRSVSFTMAVNHKDASLRAFRQSFAHH